VKSVLSAGVPVYRILTTLALSVQASLKHSSSYSENFSKGLPVGFPAIPIL